MPPVALAFYEIHRRSLAPCFASSPGCRHRLDIIAASLRRGSPQGGRCQHLMIMRVFHGPYSTLRAVFKNPTEIGAFIVIYLALAIRLSLAAFTNGTYDVGIWQRHLSSIMQDGMLDYYASSRGAQLAFNHPPLMGALMVGLFKACNWAGVEFAFVY